MSLCFFSSMLVTNDVALPIFVAFFIFAGNLARIEAVDTLLKSLLSGREYLTALLTSQIISLKLYSHSDNAHLGRFMLEFMVVNLLLLILLSVFQMAVS